MTPALRRARLAREAFERGRRFAPPARRLEQLSKAEKLLAEVDTARQYPYQFVCFRITDYRPTAYPDLIVGGEDLKHDLYQIIHELARSMPAVPVETMIAWVAKWLKSGGATLGKPTKFQVRDGRF